MTMPTLGLLFIVAFVIAVQRTDCYLDHNSVCNVEKSDTVESCGCYYNVYANMPKGAREKAACSKNCVYRTVAGRCNNRCYTDWGEAQLPYGRHLKPDYCTAIAPDAPRCSFDGTPLPGSRFISVELFQDRPPRDMDKFVTTTHMVFGQFLSHDLARTNEPKMTHDHDDDQDLCGRDQCNRNEVCFPIQVFTGDPDFSPRRCLKFHRSTRRETPHHVCRDQQNDVSSYLDLNTVYGSTHGEMEILRDARPKYNAYLNMTSMSMLRLGPNIRKGKDLLPQIDGVKKCRGKTDQIKCFMAGDRRVGEQIQLTVLHVIFAREHNRLVAKLDEVNDGCWSQERLFEEARKINIAQWQVIVYNEYLRTMFSDATMKKWGLYPNNGKYNFGYNKKINATVSNVFQTSAFRFGHTQIPAMLSLAYNDFTIYKNVSFSAAFNSPTLIYDPMSSAVTGTDAISFGMIALSAEAADFFFNKQLTRSFDADQVDGLGRDLEAIDIERGRDHGLPGYNAWRKFCNLPYAVSSFDDFIDIPPHRRVKLSMIYRSVEDVDLFVGAMAERLEPGALVGPTFSCLNAEQFSRVKFGDRFWHENPLGGLNKPQLESISKITFAKILCDNLDDPVTMPPNVFIHPRSKAMSLFSDVTSEWSVDFVYSVKVGHDNEPIPCGALPGTNLNLWKETGCWNPNCGT